MPAAVSLYFPTFWGANVNDYSTMGIGDLLGFIWSGKLREARELFEAVTSRDPARIEKELRDVLVAFDQAEYDQPIRDLVAAIKFDDPNPTSKWARVLKCSTVIVSLICDEFIKNPLPVPPVIVGTMARKPINELTLAEREQWAADNKGQIRVGAETWYCRKALRKLPEVQAALEGKMTTAELDTLALDPDQVVKWLNRAILLLTAGSVFYPPLGAVVVILKMILARYETNNPDIGLPLSVLAA